LQGDPVLLGVPLVPWANLPSACGAWPAQIYEGQENIRVYKGDRLLFLVLAASFSASPFLVLKGAVTKFDPLCQ